jgi:transposase-like protein
MVHAETREAVEQARASFLRKCGCGVSRLSAPSKRPVMNCSHACSSPSCNGKRFRTTNALERINEEFHRRTKAQASLPDEDAVLLLLYVLLRSGQMTTTMKLSNQTLASTAC